MACGEYSQIFGKKIRTLCWLYREKIFRSLYIKKYLYRTILKTLIYSDNITPLQRAKASYLLDRTSFIYTPTRHVTRCFNSGRTRFVIRHVGLSRMAFRSYLRIGKLPNIVKTTW